MTDTNELFDSRELQAERSFTSRDMLRIVFKHKLAILICCMGVSLIVGFAVWWLPPTFVAEGKILVVTERQGNPSFFSGIAAYREPPMADPVNRKMETEMELITTREISERVVRQLGIKYEQVYRKPYIVFLDPVSAAVDWFKLNALGKAPDPEARGFKDTVNAFNQSFIIEPMKSKSADTTSNVISIVIKSVDATVAQKAVAALMENYIAYSVEQTRGEGEEAYKVVSAQKDEAFAALMYAESAMQSFLSNRGENLDIASEGNLTPSKVSNDSVSSPSALVPGRQSVVGTLKQRLVDLQLRLGEMRQIYHDDSQNVLQLKSAVTDLERKVSVEVRANAEAEVEVSKLTRARKMAEDHYQELERKLDQIGLYLKLSKADADTRRIVEMPQKPKSSEWKKDIVVVILGSIAGLVLGFGIAGYREYTDHRLHSADDLEHHLGLNTLAVIPDLDQVQLALILSTNTVGVSRAS
jgi:tyrosine-protein kinase Etk/Wzc